MDSEENQRNLSQEEELARVIKKRNKRLVNLFKIMELPVKVIGDENVPVLIYDERIKIKAYVHNFELRFMENDEGGECIYMIKLLEKPVFDKNRVMECINSSPVCYVNNIALNNTRPLMFLTGFNFLNKEEKLGKYPVFAAYSPNIYLSTQKALEIVGELKNDGYDCSVKTFSDK